MSLRCDCPNGRDEIVFGPVHQCSEPVSVLQVMENRIDRAFFALAAEPRYMETLDEDERTGH